MVNASGDPFAKYDLRELTGHKHKVNTVAWNSNGKRLASGSDDGNIKIWRLDNRHGKPERAESELAGHTGAVVFLRWDPAAADRLASISQDKTLRIWDARSSRCLGTVKTLAGPLFVSWKHDGSEVAFVDRSDSISVVDAKTVKLVRSHRYTDCQVNEMLWSHDGKLCFAALGTGVIEVLEYPSFQKLRSFVGHSSSLYAITLDPSGRYLASAGNDACISLWDTTDMVCLKTFVGMDNFVNQMSFSHNSKYLAYLDHKLGICIVDIDSGVVVHTIPTGNHNPDSVEWNPRHLVLAWPGAFTTDYRDSSRDSGPVIVFAPT